MVQYIVQYKVQYISQYTVPAMGPRGGAIAAVTLLAVVSEGGCQADRIAAFVFAGAATPNVARCYPREPGEAGREEHRSAQ